EQETPDGFREFLEMAARQGYERIPSAIQSQLEDGKLMFAPSEAPPSHTLSHESLSASAIEIDSGGRASTSQ
ncbi:MAG TPA: hypothetical protein VN843_21845, partial [Anaerolineales bacterium]|nr:hypothetical protein [Anaerolineales bacterium]